MAEVLNHCRQKHFAKCQESLVGLDEHEQLDRLCELNVKEQVRNVCDTPVVQNIWKKGGELTVHGWIYNINNGHLRDMGGVDSSNWSP